MTGLRLPKFSLNDSEQAERWDSFVRSHSDGTPFHLSSWLRTLLETYPFQPQFYVSLLPDDRINGIFPCVSLKSFPYGRRLVSIPFSDYGGPLLSHESNELDLINTVLADKEKRIKCIEVRGRVPVQTRFLKSNYYRRHILDLTAGIDELRKVMDKRTIQYSIRKAEKAGVKVREENTPEGIDEFYRLNVLTRRKHGVPWQPRKFFQNLLKNVIQKQGGFILVASQQGTAIGASIFMTINGSILYKYNASHPDLLRKTSPNHLLTWHAILKGSSEGYASFDFGRTSPDNQGLMRYKRMWGADELELPYFYYPRMAGASSHKEASLSYRIVTHVWKSLPYWAAERISPLLYRYMG